MTRLSTDRQLLVQLKQAYVTYVESVAQLKVDSSFREAAAMRADIARKQYNNGLLSFQDWDTIESDYIKRQKNYLASKRDRVINESNWEKALGRGVIP
jgi:outer membrane protein TolC